MPSLRLLGTLLLTHCAASQQPLLDGGLARDADEPMDAALEDAHAPDAAMTDAGSAEQTPPRLAGVNLAGLEFSEDTFPGIYDTHYTSPTASEITWFTSRGMNAFRIPFRWERLQPVLHGDLSTGELGRLLHLTELAAAQNAYVILDPHNYARFAGDLVGSPDVPAEALADFWARMTAAFVDHDNVIFGLMNEPHDMPTEQWFSAAQAAVDAIRAAAGTHWISVPGNGWTGAHNWHDDWYGTPNALVMGAIDDPLERIVFEFHQYLDDDFSGRAATCTQDGAAALAEVTEWLRTQGALGFLGELGAGASPECNARVTAMLEHLRANSEQWIGWTWWAAGPWWGDYFMSLEPQGTTAAAQFSTLAPYLE